MAPGTLGALLGGGGDPPGGGMLLVRGWGVAPLAGGTLLGVAPGLSVGWPEGNVASPGAFVAGSEPALVGGALALGAD